jgi:hypothetical protein
MTSTVTFHDLPRSNSLPPVAAVELAGNGAPQIGAVNGREEENKDRVPEENKGGVPGENKDDVPDPGGPPNLVPPGMHHHPFHTLITHFDVNYY